MVLQYSNVLLLVERQASSRDATNVRLLQSAVDDLTGAESKMVEPPLVDISCHACAEITKFYR